MDRLGSRIRCRDLPRDLVAERHACHEARWITLWL
jgi:hypothetical protein